jgi:glucokinase
MAGIVREPPNLPGWQDVPLLARLRECLDHPLGERPLYLENDANAAALGEHRYGAGRGVSDLVYLTISTGIGGGIIVDGRVVQGQNGNAGEIGHMSVAHDGWPCPCGSRGCLEAFCSGTNIAARARARLLAGEASRLGTGMAPAAITARDVAEAARAGDPLAVSVWDETTTVLGAGVANVINLMNPRLVILGGGVTRAGEQLLGPVRRIALERAFPYLASVADVVLAQLGPDTGIVGAIAVAQTRLAAETRSASMGARA